MVCKNCGADLKPGIKYCLNCGEYIEDDDSSKPNNELSLSDVDDQKRDSEVKIGDDYSFEGSTKKEKKPLFGKLSTTDLLIYGVLVLIIVVSLIVILVSLVGGKKEQVEVQPTSTVVADHTVKMKDYFRRERISFKYNPILWLARLLFVFLIY